VDALHGWLTVQLARVSGKSGLAEAIRYALRHWPGLVLFLEDGRIELDNNTVERALRPIALGRKNAHDRPSRVGTTKRVRGSTRSLSIDRRPPEVRTPGMPRRSLKLSSGDRNPSMTLRPRAASLCLQGSGCARPLFLPEDSL
jgi:hypothetical protein